jgi:hypothetical protein
LNFFRNAANDRVVNKAKPHIKTGRPTVYTRSKCALAYRYSLLGATNTDLARFFAVDERTILRWQHDHPEFCRALKSGKDEADAQVSDRLFKRATGYSHPDVVINVCGGKIEKTRVVKHYPPDTTAAIFWLKNRQREKWRDVQRLEHAGPGGGPIETTNANVDDLLAELVKRGESLPTCAVIPIQHSLHRQ